MFQSGAAPKPIHQLSEINRLFFAISFALCCFLSFAPFSAHAAASATNSGGTPMDQTVFANVKRAAIVPDHGVPKLTINGKPVLPYIFFYNTSLPMEFLAPQVKAAAENGVHIYSMDFVGWSWLEEGETGEGNFLGSGRTSRRFYQKRSQRRPSFSAFTRRGAQNCLPMKRLSSPAERKAVHRLRRIIRGKVAKETSPE